jgi:hypothetical protein
VERLTSLEQSDKEDSTVDLETTLMKRPKIKLSITSTYSWTNKSDKRKNCERKLKRKLKVKRKGVKKGR